MKYEQKLEIDCPECNQKYKILYNSKEVIEFCPFCGELIVKPTDEEVDEFGDEDFDLDSDDDNKHEDW